MNVFLIVFSYIALLVFGLIDNSRGPVYPEILNFFSINKSQGALFFTLSSIMAFIVNLFSSRILSKTGVVNSLKISLLLMVLATLVYGYAGQIDGAYPLFILGSIILGSGVGLLSVSNNLLISKNSPTHLKQQLFSGLHSMYGLSSFAAPLLYAYVLTSGVSWQNFFYILSAFPLLALIIFMRAKNDTFEIKHTSENKIPKSIFIPLGILLSFYVSSEILVSTRLVIFLKEYWSFSSERASSFLSIFFFLLLSGRLSFAFIRIPINPLLLLKISALSSICLFILGIKVSPIFLPVLGLSMSYFFPCSLGWLSNKYSANIDKLITILMMFVNGMIVIIHSLFGIISDSYGIVWAFSLGFFFQALVLYLLQKQTR